ncbi:unnamed protein product, partial [Staurois parvus]
AGTGPPGGAAGTGSPGGATGIRPFGSPAGTASSGKAVGTKSPGTTVGTGSSGMGLSGSTAGIGVNWHNRIIRLDQFIRLGIRLGGGIRLNCGRRSTRLHHGRQVLRWEADRFGYW